MRRYFSAAVLCVLALTLTILQASGKTKPLQIYSIDVEGGQATLLVTPAGQSLLVDTGWPGYNGRDADRIVAAAKAAGVKEIDYVLITHYHRDHVGGVPQLADRIKIGTFVDHGPNQEDSDVTREDYAAYEKVLPQAKHLTVKAGDRIPVKGIRVDVLSAAGGHITSPLFEAGQPNFACNTDSKAPADTTENARSLGILVTYDNFKFLDMGDLTKDKERELVCPINLIGTVNLFLVTHHGFNQSNSKSFVEAVHPQVAIMNNGAHKGGSPDAWQIVHDVVGRDALWQLHYAVEGGPDHNVPQDFIANPDEKNDAGAYIKVNAYPDGMFEVINSRNNKVMTYGHMSFPMKGGQ